MLSAVLSTVLSAVLSAVLETRGCCDVDRIRPATERDRRDEAGSAHPDLRHPIVVDSRARDEAARPRKGTTPSAGGGLQKVPKVLR